MPEYEIQLFKKANDKIDNKVFKKIIFTGLYIEALRQGRNEMLVNKCKDFEVPIASSKEEFLLFLNNFQSFSKKNKKIVANTLSNIFTMRLIGNKTHGDLAEVGITEFINQFMPNYSCEHVGKDLYRAKGHEEDIVIKNDQTDKEIPVSLKAYGDGPLQLSTDKDSLLWNALNEMGDCIDDRKTITRFFIISCR